jgi:predicted aminopeptidase
LNAPVAARPFRHLGARRAWAAAILLLLGALTMAGCSPIGYYVQAARGQWGLLAAARPIDDWLADPSAPESLKQRLQLARRMREFATRELAEPDNRSYTRYADLKRPAVVWNVFATPELSTQLKTWCYPLFGCASYRGYFDRSAADRLAAELAAQGYDVSVGPVQAYSTLGWFADPLLNTFINLPEPELARLIFHELAHQIVYVRDDTVFNESFATAVEREGVRRWLQAEGSDPLRAEWQQMEQRRTQFLQLVTGTRDGLDRIYAGSSPDADKRARKRALFAELQDRYHALRDGAWGGFKGYDRFFAQPLNNAHLAAIGAYYDRVPAFEALMRRTGTDMAALFREVKRLAALRKDRRDRELDALSEQVSSP